MSQLQLLPNGNQPDGTSDMSDFYEMEVSVLHVIHVGYCSSVRAAYVNKALRRVFMHFTDDSAGQRGGDALSQTGGLFSERGAGDRSNGTLHAYLLYRLVKES